MRKVIAAITDDSAAAAVLSTSSAVASLFSATAEALHAGEGNATVADAARKAGVKLTTVAGGAVEVITRVAAAEDVAAVVIGARGTSAASQPAASQPASQQPAGSTAIALVTSLERPVVVVPPNAVVGRGIQTVLVPLNGTALSAEALREVVELAAKAQLRVVVAHVYLERSLPAFSDHLPHEVRAWTDEFIARHCPSAVDVTLELRVADGEPEEHVLDILLASQCDLVALGWSQDLAEGHAAIVRRMLTESPVPVLLIPVNARAQLPPVDAGPAVGAVDGG